MEGIFLSLTAALFFSGADLMRKLGLIWLSSAIMTSALGGMADLILQALVGACQGVGKEMGKLDRRTWSYLAGSGLFYSLAVITLNAALSLAPIAIVSALYSTRIWFVIAVGPLLLGAEERITRALVVSTLCILAGILLLILT